jgi:hypothetical protein
VLEVATPFFRCYEGGKHTNYLCEQLERTNRAYDPKLTDIMQLFDNLFNPVREKEVSPWGPEEDEDPGVLDPEDETIDGDEHTQAPEDGTDDDDEDEWEATSGPVIVPCKTLSQLWKAGIYKFGPSERIGSHLRSDIFLWYKDFDQFFVRNTSLEERVIAVRPSGRSTEPTPFSLRPLAAFVEPASIKRSILYWCSGTARNTIRLAKSCSAAVQMMLEQAERKRSMIWCWWPVTGQNWMNLNTVPTG